MYVATLFILSPAQPMFEMFIVPASISVSGDQEDLLSVKYTGVVWLLGFRVLLFVPRRASFDLCILKLHVPRVYHGRL